MASNKRDKDKADRKIKHLDFTLADNEFETIIFRFLPRHSSCHSFGSKPPTCWEEVYKVYYAYEIINISKLTGKAKKVYKCHCDECSVIDEIAIRCKLIADGHRYHIVEREDETYKVKLLNVEVKPFGYGTSWKLTKSNGNTEIQLFRWDNKGYRFRLDKETLRKFGEHLEECCEYMLAHGDPI